MCLCVGLCIWVPVLGAGQKCQIQIRSYRQTWSTCCGWWELSPDPLQEQYILITEPSIQSPKAGNFHTIKELQFKGCNSLVHWHVWLKGTESTKCTCCMFRTKAKIKLYIQHGQELVGTPQIMLHNEGVLLLSMFSASTFSYVALCGFQPVAWAFGL